MAEQLLTRRDTFAQHYCRTVRKTHQRVLLLRRHCQDRSLPAPLRQSRFSEEQIISILKEYQARGKELCRKHGISNGKFYKWRSKYGGMGLGAKRLKALETENANLKTILAEHMLDVATLEL